MRDKLKKIHHREQRAMQLVSLMLCMLLCLFACEDRPITYFLESELNIHASWHESTLADEEEAFGATTVFFPAKGTDMKQILMGTRDEEKVRLTEGVYHAIIFNRSIDGFASIHFTGNGFEEYTAAVRQVETRTDPASRAQTRVLLATPEELAIDVVESVRVTESMLGNYGQKNATQGNQATSRAIEESEPGRYIVRFTPQKMTRKVKVNIQIEGINNLRSTIATIDGVSESINLSTKQCSPTTAVQQFELPIITYNEGSPFDGTLSGEFNVFGFDLEGTHALKLKMLLVDNKTIVEKTLQAKAEARENDNGEITIMIQISLPEPLPTVKPEGAPDSGFDADVDEWGDPEEVPLN